MCQSELTEFVAELTGPDAEFIAFVLSEQCSRNSIWLVSPKSLQKKIRKIIFVAPQSTMSCRCITRIPKLFQIDLGFDDTDTFILFRNSYPGVYYSKGFPLALVKLVAARLHILVLGNYLISITLTFTLSHVFEL